MWDSSTVEQLENFPTISELLEDFAAEDEIDISELEPLSRDVGTVENESEESWSSPTTKEKYELHSYLEYEEDVQESCEIKPFSAEEIFHFRNRSESSSLSKQDYSRLLHRLDMLTERVGALTAISEKLRGELIKKREPASHKRNPPNGNQKSKKNATQNNSLTESMISSASSMNVESPKNAKILKSRKRPAIPFNSDEETELKNVMDIRNKVSRGLDRKSKQELNPLIPVASKIPRRKRGVRLNESATSMGYVPFKTAIISKEIPSPKNVEVSKRRANKSFGNGKGLDLLLGPVSPELPDHLHKTKRAKSPLSNKSILPRPQSYPKVVRGLIVE